MSVRWDPATEERYKQAKKTYEHPAAAHIPKEFNVGWTARRFPWRAVGARVILMMLKGEERRAAVRDDHGKPMLGADGKPLEIVLPAVAGARGKDKELCIGLVVSYGPGEIQANGHYMSPEWDYGVHLGAACFIEPNTGVIMGDDDNEWRKVECYEIVMVGREDVGTATLKRWREAVDRRLSKYDEKDVELSGFAPNPIGTFGKPDFEIGMEDAIEEGRSARGRPMRSSFPVDPKLPAVVKE